MKPDALWNVFVPQQIWRETAGYLAGCVDQDNGLIYVSGIAGTNTNISGAVNPIGFWSNTEQNSPLCTKPRGCTLWVSLSVEGGTIHCSLLVRSPSDCLETKPAVCVLFDPYQVMKSFTLIRARSNNLLAEDEVPDKTCESDGLDNIAHRLRSKKDSGPNEALSQANEGGNVSRHHFLPTLKQMLQRSSPYDFPVSSSVKLFYNCETRHESPTVKVPWFVMWTLCCLERIILAGVNGLKICCSPFPRIIHTPSIFQYLQEKSLRWKMCFSLKRSERFNNFLKYNCYSQQLLDTLLGLAVIAMVTSYNFHHLAAVAVLDWADGVASQLTGLVQWLMGAPAGLKLNAQLTKFFGHFFIYHIYLWTGYVSLLRSVMPCLLWHCSLVGVLGVSAQLCLLRDLLSMLTLHIYCFYVYAAKIFSLQVYMLGSLWRLFRGKKWNVLRSRVDSATYSTDQLFMGTLFFTVLLFLLPTTALYYAVFTLLRLATLTVQGCLAYMLDLIMAAPVFTLVVKLLRPKLVAGNVKFTIQHAAQDESCLLLLMQTCPIPLSDLLGLTKPLFTSPSKHGHSWPEFVSHLAMGRLVYPWVEPHHTAVSYGKMD